ncbi:MAG: hypothetical protein HLUCCA11_22030 [Phormidesmis priestleyi Ana]|uniref:Tetratricopeptide repeat n=1 Tax=Phormidesmis priestleyi Ana TaxID=1666911 RepID=A0A0P7ZQU0_9CYAN|nr:MAG: hypothetical protein HLUCCA11_22030 [Phormidesmis priestleyi Ana]
MYSYQSQTYTALQQYEKGIEVAEVALEILAETNAREVILHTLYAQSNHYYNLAERAYKERDYVQALSFSEQALDIAQQHLTLSEEAVQVVVEDFPEGGPLDAYIESEEERQNEIEFALANKRIRLHRK